MSREEMNRVRGTLLHIVEAAELAGLQDFLVIGGNAVIAHGVPRFTRDVDLVIPENQHLRWRDFLGEQGFQFIHGTPAFVQFKGSGEGDPRIDLMLVDQATWENLSSGAWHYDFADGQSAGLVSPQHLIAMKLRACLSEYRRDDARDWTDILNLCLVHHFDPAEDENFSDFVIKFGNVDLRNRLADEIANRRRES